MGAGTEERSTDVPQIGLAATCSVDDALSWRVPQGDALSSDLLHISNINCYPDSRKMSIMEK